MLIIKRKLWRSNNKKPLEGLQEISPREFITKARPAGGNILLCLMEGFLAFTLRGVNFEKKPSGGILAKRLRRDIFSKTLLSENDSKNPSAAKKKNKPSNGMDYVFPPELSTRLSPAGNSMFARLGTDYEIRNQWFFAILEAMTTD